MMTDPRIPRLMQGRRCVRNIRKHITSVGVLLAASVVPLHSQPTPAELERQVRLLEDRQKIAIEGMERTYKNGFWFLGFVAGITTLLGIFRQLEDRKLLKYQEEQ